MTYYIPITPISIDGTSLSPASDSAGRTYDTGNTALVISNMVIIAGGNILTPTVQYTVLNGVITFIPEIPNSSDFKISINGYQTSITAFVGTQIQKIRYRLIQKDNTAALPDDLVAVYLSDAALEQPSTDTYAIECYTCYLMALRWQSLGFITSIEGVNRNPPDPRVFLTQYNNRIRELNSATSSKQIGGFIKVSTDKNYSYDTTTKSLTTRTNYDDY